MAEWQRVRVSEPKFKSSFARLGFDGAIRIAGAGPSGLAAAISLAKAGYDVEVYERNSDCGQRFGGDLQGVENWSEDANAMEDFRRMGIEVNFACEPVYRFQITDGRKKREVKSAEPFFYLVKRGPQQDSLDSGLKRQAVEAGAKINFSTALLEEKAHIVATGPIPKKAIGITKGIVFETAAEDIAVCLLDKKAAYRGYSYLLITKGYGCMCTAVCGELGKAGQCFQETTRILTGLYKFNIRNPRGVGGIASFSLRKNFESGGRLYVGEAAGLQDALAGFGIRASIKSGHLAAKSIIEGFNYAETARRHFSKKATATIVDRFLFETLLNRPAIRAGMKLMEASRNPRAVLKRLYNQGAARTALAPLAAAALKLKYRNL